MENKRFLITLINKNDGLRFRHITVNDNINDALSIIDGRGWDIHDFKYKFTAFDGDNYIEAGVASILANYADGWEGQIFRKDTGEILATIDGCQVLQISPEIGLSILRNWSTEEPYLCEEIRECLANQEAV